MFLIVDQLTAARGGRTLWQGLNAGWQAGQAVWLQGINGSGKTTLLEILANLRQPTSGSIAWNDNDHPLPSLLLGHRHPLHPRLTVQQNLAYWQRLWQRLADQPPSLSQILAQWNLTGLANQTIARLSAGQRQRAGLSLLNLLPHRPIWLLDEPATALDQASTQLLTDAVDRHVQQGGLCVFTSHHPLPLATPTAAWVLPGESPK